jgi:2-polyprenyl-3-methyl-5-hydroxy-6-metoxy-1,4-benzoquinol methylase
MPKSSLESVYREHHHERRGDFFLMLGQERGSFLAQKIGTGKKVLDIGCRDGALTKFYSKGNSVLGIDIDSMALARAKSALGIETVSVDLNGDWAGIMPGYDVIVAAEVLEHLYYPDQVVAKIAARLKIEIVPVVSKKFALLNKIFPNAFTHTILFCAENKK